MENFQRYFLIACVFIMSYFLIIRWDPPSNIPIKDELKNEVSTYSPKEDFGFIDEDQSVETWNADEIIKKPTDLISLL